MIWHRWKQSWLNSQESKWKEEYATKEAEWKKEIASLNESGDREASEIKETLDRTERDLDDLARRLQDKKEALEKANQELRDQLRLIEAKASPDSVWTQAFSQGFSKAWDMMLPIMSSGFDKVVERTRNESIDGALRNLDSVVNQRIEEAGQVDLKPAHELLAKKRELEQKLSQAKDSERRLQCQHYLEVVEWMLNGNPVHTD